LNAYFPGSGGELHLGGVPVRQIVEEFGTPIFVYDASVLQQKWSRLRSALPKEFSLFYSVKANPQRAILDFFLGKGCGLEIASAGEFCQAIRAGCRAENILFAGPGKSEMELETVLSAGIGEIHAESLTEIGRISRISARLNATARVALRVNPSGEAEGGAMRMGGRAAPFGVDEEQLDEALDVLCREPRIEFRGIHLFAGTQILDAATLLQQYRKGIEIARRAADRSGKPLATVDFGGGLGIPYFTQEQELDLAALRPGLEEIVREIHSDARFQGTRFLIEPGRYLVGEAGVYVSRINDIKVSRGKKFLILDGGMNHHLAASGNLGQTIKRNFPVAILNRLDQASSETVDVVGPLCTPLDVLARGVALPKAEIGDLFGVFQSGAYARSASPLGFLSHPTPAEVWVESGRARLVRRRGENEDYLRDQCFATSTAT
jgi:diaminopimelate decarboxylase